ncbi:MAG: M48 family metalloprotease [Calditrichaceae bacterium]|nr:M48 family metalloprotease [Calditrichaceae bacterium]MBN2707418.1 M48 family metalloprotease [Calditrichaceae bacterium]RQV96949.1 MAG: hypothetical protein EH224_02890 [Calditrichota bacterium]
MSNFFYRLGRKTGKAIRKPKWYYKAFFGTETEALQAENIFGQELAEHMKSEFTIIKNHRLNEFVDEVGGRLVNKVKKPERKFTFIITESADVNAFALPGGYIFLSLGILNLCQHNPDALAFILAHEMIHVLSRHPLKKIMTSKSFSMLANMLKAGNIVGHLAKQTLTDLIESIYSQEYELYADRYGLLLMVSCGYSGQACIDALKSLQERTQYNNAFNYFSTHPSLEDRIKQLRKELQNKV